MPKTLFLNQRPLATHYCSKYRKHLQEKLNLSLCQGVSYRIHFKLQKTHATINYFQTRA